MENRNAKAGKADKDAQVQQKERLKICKRQIKAGETRQKRGGARNRSRCIKEKQSAKNRAEHFAGGRNGSEEYLFLKRQGLCQMLSGRVQRKGILLGK